MIVGGSWWLRADGRIGIALIRILPGRLLAGSIAAIVQRAVASIGQLAAIFVGVRKEEGVGENHTEKQASHGEPEFHIVAHAGLLSHQADPLILTLPEYGGEGIRTGSTGPSKGYDIPAAFFKAPGGSSCLAVGFLSDLPSRVGGVW